MTAPTRSADNNVSLATLWVPVTADTSHLADGFKEAGERARNAFMGGFTGSGGGITPEKMGQSFADKFHAEFASRLRGADFGLGVSRAIEGWSTQLEKFNQVADRSTADKLAKQLPSLYREATTATEALTAAQNRLNEATERDAAAKNMSTWVAVKRAQSEVTEATTKGQRRSPPITKSSPTSMPRVRGRTTPETYSRA